KPAFDEGLKQHNAEIEAIVSNPDEPTFENTILALENSGELLNNVVSVFFNVSEADGNPEMQAIEEEYGPILTSHYDDINMNEALFNRVKSVYENIDKLGLQGEEAKLVEKYYKSFVRGGTNLSPEDKEKMKKINEELVKLTTNFGKNLLEENKKFKLVITDENDLSGLSESIRTAAAELAKAENTNGYIFTLDKPSWIPFMQFADKRELREKMYKAYINKCNNNDNLDNKKIIERIVVLRTQKANLMGYKTWADFVISDNMAKTAKNAYDLIKNIATTTIPFAKAEVAEMQKIIDREGGNFKLEPWDWWYYAEKVRKEKYNLNEDEIRPYLELNNVRKGVFTLSEKLYGLTFEQRTDLPVYNPEVETFEVKDENGELLGIMYFDYFPRAGKRAGAWMNNIREEYVKDGKRVIPVIVNVCNFTRPVGNTPSLLSIDEAETLFHEFGHALHGLVTKCKYRSISGTNVPRDLVELPSQICENWTFAPEMLKLYAKHYKTGEVIPDSLVEKIQAAKTFNQGFITLELIAASILDMDWHMIADTNQRDAVEFETASMNKMGLIKEIAPRYSSWYFNHIFGSDVGYSAGYYAYTWSAVLDADAYQAFVETGDVFNKEVATKFRTCLLEKGASEDADVLYRNFRGSDPKTDAFLKRKGFKK
ncbi:MAG: M3 family metallopeptidase, partial [Bacteroidetes bacterium]|nr:M3 family metallopeptidase [Bacteroidota bacterium]